MTERLTLTAGQAATYCAMSVKTFNKARRAGQGPDAFNAHGGRVRFAKAALDRWMSERHDADPLAPTKRARGAA
jgi:predicted DNA-binding transcriptional regulator AlpA